MPEYGSAGFLPSICRFTLTGFSRAPTRSAPHSAARHDRMWMPDRQQPPQRLRQSRQKHTMVPYCLPFKDRRLQIVLHSRKPPQMRHREPENFRTNQPLKVAVCQTNHFAMRAAVEGDFRILRE